MKAPDNRLVARLWAELARGELTSEETPRLQRELRDLNNALAGEVGIKQSP
jgi:hypothetical protein